MLIHPVLVARALCSRAPLPKQLLRATRPSSAQHNLGRLAEESPESLAQLRRNVTSPGGTTEQAINAFLQGGLPELVAAAANASKQRSIEISKELAS